MNKIFYIVLAIVFVAVGYIVMVNQSMREVSQPVSVGEVADSQDVVTISVEAGSYYFNPEEIRVKAGQKVRIELTGKDMMHDFVIDELGVASEVVPAGESTVVEFVAETAGTYEYYCSVGDHRARGQIGTLIVE